MTQEELSSLFDELAEAINVTSGGAVARSSAELRNNVQWVSRFAKAKPWGDHPTPQPTVPITASGLQGKTPLAHGIM